MADMMLKVTVLINCRPPPGLRERSPKIKCLAGRRGSAPPPPAARPEGEVFLWTLPCMQDAFNIRFSFVAEKVQFAAACFSPKTGRAALAACGAVHGAEQPCSKEGQKTVWCNVEWFIRGCTGEDRAASEHVWRFVCLQQEEPPSSCFNAVIIFLQSTTAAVLSLLLSWQKAD